MGTKLVVGIVIALAVALREKVRHMGKDHAAGAG